MLVKENSPVHERLNPVLHTRFEIQKQRGKPVIEFPIDSMRESTTECVESLTACPWN